MKYPALVYVSIYGGAVLAFLLAPVATALLFVVPMILIAEYLVSPEVWRTRNQEATHRAD